MVTTIVVLNIERSLSLELKIDKVPLFLEHKNASFLKILKNALLKTYFSRIFIFTAIRKEIGGAQI